MLEKLNETIKLYERTLARKESLIQYYIEIRNKNNGVFENIKDEFFYTEYATEIRQLKEFIEDLKYIKE